MLSNTTEREETNNNILNKFTNDNAKRNDNAQRTEVTID